MTIGKKWSTIFQLTTPSKTETTPISARVAQQRATAEIAFHCGQAFVTETPELVDGFWQVPVWVVHPKAGRLKQIGTVKVRREDGVVDFSEDDRLRLRTAGLQALSENQ